MIRVVKPLNGPKVLLQGASLVAALEMRRAADPNAGVAPQTFQFEKKIYGTRAVKSVLRKAQFDKCCFCEGIFTAFSAGDVEHFRPKARVQQKAGDPIESPGYYWLAYSWENLYFACGICNGSKKRNLFPIRSPKYRNRSPSDANREKPLIADPGGSEDPRRHVRFDDYSVKALTQVGATTIEVLGLDRIELETARLKHFKHLQALATIVALPSKSTISSRREKAEAASQLKAFTGPAHQFSSMSMDFVERLRMP